MKRFIITADDCGLSEGINQAAAALHKKGMLTAASVMTNMPAAEHAFELFKQCPGLEVGIHLNISDGLPLTRPESPSPLTRTDGHFRRRLISMLRTIVPTPNFLELFEAEMHAQLEVFMAQGLQPGHVTTHRHFHASPLLRKVIVKLARRYNIPWLRAYRLSASIVPHNIFHSSGTEDQDSKPLFVPDHLISIKSWMSREPDELVDVLLELEGVAEFIVHPCTATDDTFPRNIYYPPEERYAETQYFERVYTRYQERIMNRAQ